MFLVSTLSSSASASLDCPSSVVTSLDVTFEERCDDVDTSRINSLPYDVPTNHRHNLFARNNQYNVKVE